MQEDTTLLLKVFATYVRAAQPPAFNADAAFLLTAIAQAIGEGYPTFESLPPLAHEIIAHTPDARHPQEAISMFNEQAAHAAQHPIFKSIQLLQQNQPTPEAGKNAPDSLFYIFDEETQSFGEPEHQMYWALYELKLTDPKFAQHLSEQMTWTTTAEFA